MKNMEQYKVTCLKCKGSNKVIITDVGKNRQEYMIDLNTDHQKSPGNIYIISGRYRGDMRFGWECICGQDSRVARQEADQIDRLVVNGGESAIQKIMSSLAVQDDKKFTMERL
jgi:hypothetical protein